MDKKSSTWTRVGKATMTTGREQPASSPPGEATERQDDGESRTDIRERKIIYRDSGQQSHRETAGDEKSTSSSPDHSQRLDNSESRKDIKEQEIIYMELSRQGHTATTAPAPLPPIIRETAATAKPTAKRERTRANHLLLPLLLPLPLPLLLVGDATPPVGSAKRQGLATTTPAPSPPSPRDCSEERRDDSDVRMGSERNRRDAFGRGRLQAVSSMAVPTGGGWPGRVGGGSMAALR